MYWAKTKMKVAITGHTSGIGKELYKNLECISEELVGYSMTEGNDIGQIKTRKKILREIKNFDVFINNAFHKKGQTELLTEIIELWKGSDKLIVNIGSKAIFVTGPNLFASLEEELTFSEYQREKRKQQELIQDRYLESKPNILNCVIGPVNSGFSRFLRCKKLDPKAVADTVTYCITNRKHIQVQEIMLDVPNQSWREIKRQ